MTQNVQVRYQAKRTLLERVNKSLAAGSTTYTQAEADAIFRDMQDLIPVGSRVSASYLKSIFDTEPTEVSGCVIDSMKLGDDEEPLFLIAPFSGGAKNLMKGSVITLVS